MRGGKPRFEPRPQYDQHDHYNSSRYVASRSYPSHYAQQQPDSYHDPHYRNPASSEYRQGTSRYAEHDEYEHPSSQQPFQSSSPHHSSRHRRDQSNYLDYSRHSSPYSAPNSWKRDYPRDDPSYQHRGRYDATMDDARHEHWQHSHHDVPQAASRKRPYANAHMYHSAKSDWQRSHRPFRREHDRAEMDYDTRYERDNAPPSQSNVPADLSSLLKNRDSRHQGGASGRAFAPQTGLRRKPHFSDRQTNGWQFQESHRQQIESGGTAHRDALGGDSREPPRIRLQTGNTNWNVLIQSPVREEFPRMNDTEYSIFCEFPYGVVNGLWVQEWEFIDPDTGERVQVDTGMMDTEHTEQLEDEMQPEKDMDVEKRNARMQRFAADLSAAKAGTSQQL